MREPETYICPVTTCEPGTRHYRAFHEIARELPDVVQCRDDGSLIEFVQDLLDDVQTLEHELKSVKKQLGQTMRKGDSRAKQIIELLDKQANLRHEIRRLEDLLAWVAVTDAPDYREVIKHTVARAMKRAGGEPDEVKVMRMSCCLDGTCAAHLALDEIIAVCNSPDTYENWAYRMRSIASRARGKLE